MRVGFPGLVLGVGPFVRFSNDEGPSQIGTVALDLRRQIDNDEVSALDGLARCGTRHSRPKTNGAVLKMG